MTAADASPWLQMIAIVCFPFANHIPVLILENIRPHSDHRANHIRPRPYRVHLSSMLVLKWPVPNPDLISNLVTLGDAIESLAAFHQGLLFVANPLPHILA